MAASLARAARVSAIVIGRMSLARAQVVDAVVASSTPEAGWTREAVAAEIARTMAPLVSAGAGAGGAEAVRGRAGGPGRAGGRRPGAALWLTSERCLVGLWPDPPPVTPFVALLAEDAGEDVAAPWRRELARIGLIYETDRLRALDAGPAAPAADPVPLTVAGPIPIGAAAPEGGPAGGGVGGDAPGGDAAGGAVAQGLLNLIAIGLVLCDRAGRVIYANAAAEAWMREPRAIALSGGGAGGLSCGARLVARRADLRPRLDAALAAAATGEPRIPGALALPRMGTDSAPDMITVIPFGSGPHALVVLGGGAWDADRAEPALRALGLTASERRLVGHLCRGRPLEDAAGEAEVTISTARTYLKRIFAKTGTHRQSELVALLTALSPPVATRAPIDLVPPRAPRRPAGPVSELPRRPQLIRGRA